MHQISGLIHYCPGIRVLKQRTQLHRLYILAHFVTQEQIQPQSNCLLLGIRDEGMTE